MEFQYKGLKGTLTHLTVTEEEIDRQLKRLEGQDTSEFTPEELRQGVADSLRTYYDEQAEQELMDDLIRQAAATLDYTPTEEEQEEGAQAQLETLKAQLAKRELTLEAYCSFMNTTEEAILEDMRSDALSLLRMHQAMLEIARLEGFTAEKEEVDEACRQICRANQLSAEEFARIYDETMAQTVKESVLCNKAMALVREQAEIEEIYQ